MQVLAEFNTAEPTEVEYNGESFEVFGHVQIFDRDIFAEEQDDG